MTTNSEKEDLQRYLQAARDALVWKLDGLSEYDIRRPMTTDRDQLVGSGQTHDRRPSSGISVRRSAVGFPISPRGCVRRNSTSTCGPRADESTADIVETYRRTWAFADATIEEHDLDAPGFVKHWPEDRRDVTLHRILVHVVTEIHRHAGHADIVRELIDGAAWDEGGRQQSGSRR